MGLHLDLEDEHGLPVPAGLSVPRNLAFAVATTSQAVTGLRVLDHIDLYGRTVLNTLQAELLIEDIARLSSETDLPPGIQESLDALKLYAEHCASEPHTFLVFTGD